MFGIPSGMIPRPFDNPQRYHGDFRPPSPDPLSHSYPSQEDRTSHHRHPHHHHPHSQSPSSQNTLHNSRHNTVAITAAAVEDEAPLPIRRHEVVFPTRRAPRHPPQPCRRHGPLSQPTSSSTGSEDTPTASAGSGSTPPTSAVVPPVAPSTRAQPQVDGHGDGHRSHHHHHHRSPYDSQQQQPGRRARSSETRRGAANAAASTAGGDPGTAATPHHRAPHFSEVLASGLRGLQTYMGMVFQSSNRGGLGSLHPTPYDVDSANSTYRVPESPEEPLVQRTSSEIVTERERRRQVKTQVTGIPIDEQHKLLTRLRFRRSAFPLDADGERSGAASVCNSTATPLSTLTPLSAFMPHDDGEGGVTLESWVVSLDVADPLQVPFPAVSQSCSVCLRRFLDEEDVAELGCGHLYHFTCIIRWLRRQGSCPCCRADVRKLHSASAGDAAEDAGDTLATGHVNGAVGI